MDVKNVVYVFYSSSVFYVFYLLFFENKNAEKRPIALKQTISKHRKLIYILHLNLFWLIRSVHFQEEAKAGLHYFVATFPHQIMSMQALYKVIIIIFEYACYQ